ncbi:hypothetical protein [Pseudomonas sp. Irchel s3h14]|uniref:hypothetical protein n=1 Tax=Pseudomonas sp. Irchel s3h14 TaxID=2009179 RepID=UPI000BA3DBF4|nr:hypothetical protein [Pseudomonas sp. Irchel s3h14]
MPRVAAEGGEGADDCSQRLAAVGMNGGDDLVNQRADLFVVNVFFGHGFASPAVHRQAVCGLVGYAGKQATRERKRSLITDGSK